MRLINTATTRLEYFVGAQECPPYAILSHTWGDDEVSLQDMADLPVATAKKGYSKIQQTCRRAREMGLSHAWVDTCCIDKTSSAELTEAINSMFQWYAASAVCYAFIADLSPGSPVVDDNDAAAPEFAQSRWFMRGWTLQELIAPTVVEFYDGNWGFRGQKGDLSPAISAVTNIDMDVLRDASLLADVPVARKMSWAAGRQTTRVEDRAYSLLGIFDVNMPMLYGEGDKAFIRLQDEIVKQVNDLTLFAWQEAPDSKSSLPAQKYRGVFARSPDEFAGSADITSTSDPRLNDEFAMTNKGLRISPYLFRDPHGGDFIAGLNCHRRGDAGKALGIHLRHYGAGLHARSRPRELAVRASHDAWAEASVNGVTMTMGSGGGVIYISKHIGTPALSASVERASRLVVRFGDGFGDGDGTVSTAMPKNLWDVGKKAFLMPPLGQAAATGFAGELYFQSTKVWADILAVGFGIPATGIAPEVAGVMKGPEGAGEEGLPRIPWARFLNIHQPDLQTPTMHEPARMFQLPGKGTMEKKIVMDLLTQVLTRLVISITPEQGDSTDESNEAMYCIDVRVDDSLPQPSMDEYRTQYQS